MKVGEIGMRGDDQGLRPAKGCKGEKIRNASSRGRIQNEHMPTPDADLDSRNQEDPPFPGIGRKLPVERDAVMVRDGQDVIPIFRCVRNKLLRSVPDPVDGIFRRVKVEINLQGS